MADRLDLIVHPLHGPIGNPDAGPGQHPVEVGAEHPSELLERLQPTMAGAPEPLAQVGLRPSGAAVVPKTTEVFLEEIALDDGTVQSQQGGEAGALLASEVPRVREPEEARLLGLPRMG